MRDTPHDDGPLEPPPAPNAEPPPAPGTTRIHERGLLIATRIGKQLQRAIWIGMAVAFVSAFAIGFALPSPVFTLAVLLGVVAAWVAIP